MPSPLKMIQAVLPGMRPLRGAERVAGKPGMWAIDPTELSTTEWLKRAEKRATHEGDMVRAPDGVPSVSGQERARGADMLAGALNELNYASIMPKSPSSKAVKGVVYVDKNGNVRAGTALNKEKAAEYLADDFDLDFTKAHPNYLEYVSTTTPDAQGSALMRIMQELHGDDMVFQVANPKKNIPIYERMGAQRMAPRMDGGDALGGSEGLPAYRLEQRIPEKTEADLWMDKIRALEAAGQERLPGFAGGGPVRGALSRIRAMLDSSSKVVPAGLLDRLPPEQLRALQEGAIDARLPLEDFIRQYHPSLLRDKPDATDVMGFRG